MSQTLLKVNAPAAFEAITCLVRNHERFEGDVFLTGLDDYVVFETAQCFITFTRLNNQEVSVQLDCKPGSTACGSSLGDQLDRLFERGAVSADKVQASREILPVQQEKRATFFESMKQFVLA